MLASRIASSEPPRTKVSIVTSAGTTLTASPPLVMIGWMRIVSLSWKVSRWAVDRVQCDLRRVKGVDAELRRAAGMAARPMKADLLDQRAVRRIGDVRSACASGRASRCGSSSPCRCRRNGPWRRVRACRAGTRSRPCATPAEPLLDIDELLGRHGEEHQFAGEVFGGARRRSAPSRRRACRRPGRCGRSCGPRRYAGRRAGGRRCAGCRARR